jgi:hypothetical protein
MKLENRIKTANILRKIARYSLLLLGLLIFVFALLSGAESHGNSIEAIIENSPNAAPWFLLLIFLAIAWKWELIGGILIIILVGGFSIYLLSLKSPNFFLAPFIFFFVIIVLSSFFIISWYLRRPPRVLENN